MKMKCAHCGGVISSKCNYCNLCGESTRKQRSKRRMIMIGGIAAVLIACVILHGNYLMPWQIPLYKDRKAIIQYVRENHPNSKIVEEHIQYKVIGYVLFISDIFPDCYITYGEDGFEYVVSASEGKVNSDFYSKMKLRHEVDEFIVEGYLNPNGIGNVDIYSSFNLDDDELPSEWSEYNGKLYVYIKINEQGSTPYEVGWLYDFYKFWCENQRFTEKWYINFEIDNNGGYGYDRDCAFYVGYDEKIDNAAQMYEKAFPKYD